MWAKKIGQLNFGAAAHKFSAKVKVELQYKSRDFYVADLKCNFKFD